MKSAQKFCNIPMLFTVILFSACSTSKKIPVQVPSYNVEDSSVVPTSRIDVRFRSTGMSTISYNNGKAIGYAKKYASQSANSCGVFINDGKNSDCSHFIAHCLNAGGIKITNKNPDINFCPDGLVFRNPEIVSALKALSQNYNNVQAIDKTTAIVGDYLFLLNILKFRISHAMMVCEAAVNIEDYKIYGHTANRNCEVAESSVVQFYDAAYRITDAK